jgi:nitronate monooxygenase
MDPSPWPDTRLLDLLGIEVPIVQAPMAGAQGGALTIAVSEAGALGSLPCALLTADQIRGEIAIIRAATSRPVNVNFFCHTPARAAAAGATEERWRRLLAPYYAELGLDADTPGPDVEVAPFDEARCEVVEELRPEVVSFHFGLPDTHLLERVQATGARVLSSATTVDEARWLADQGCDAVIAQGAEAGGHRAMFLAADIADVATQLGTIALVPQVADAIDIPVIAAGGIADDRGIAAALMLGASGVQIGTAYLLCPEAQVSQLHAAALRSPAAAQTALTNVFTGRPARSIVTRLMRDVGPLCPEAPPFPLAAGAVLPLRAAAEQAADTSFTSLWSGQAAALARELPASELTRTLAAGALQRLR